MLSNISKLLHQGLNNISSNNQSIQELSSSFEATPLQWLMDEGLASLLGGQPDREGIRALGLAIVVLDSTLVDAISSNIYQQAPSKRLDRGFESKRHDSANSPVENALGFLSEMALVGFANIGKEKIINFEAALLEIEDLIEFQRFTMFVRAFLDELVGTLSTVGDPEKYSLRWTLLWARVIMLAIGFPTSIPQEVNDKIQVLAVELMAREHLASIHVYCISEEGQFFTLQFPSYSIEDINLNSTLALIGSHHPEMEVFLNREVFEKKLRISGTITDGICRLKSAQSLDEPSDWEVVIKTVHSGPMLNQSLLWFKHPILVKDKSTPILDLIKLPDEIVLEEGMTFGFVQWDFSSQSLVYLPFTKKLEHEYKNLRLPMGDQVKGDNIIELMQARASKLLRQKK